MTIRRFLRIPRTTRQLDRLVDGFIKHIAVPFMGAFAVFVVVGLLGAAANILYNHQFLDRIPHCEKLHELPSWNYWTLRRDLYQCPDGEMIELFVMSEGRRARR